jgi:hypothetical protein
VTLRRRIGKALRESTSLEGLVAALVGGGVWAVASAVLAQFTEFRIGPAVAAGLGFGLIAVAGFIWFVAAPRRNQERERADVMRSLARQDLSKLAEEGHWDWSRAMNPDEGIAGWRRDVDSFLLEAFGRQMADEVMALPSMEQQAARLDELNRELDDLKLRPGFRGWRRGS